MDLLVAFKTKVEIANKQAESAWRSDWNALFEKIQPGNRRTVSSAIEQFPRLTVALIRTKAAMMMGTVSENLEYIPVCLDEQKMEVLRDYVLIIMILIPVIKNKKFKQLSL